MAYKRNPMRAERISGLARFVISLQANTAHTAASQWLERTLDDSANRRLTLPEGFLATDAILVLATNIAAGLEVREDGHSPARERADAVHGHRALADAGSCRRRRPPVAARGHPAAQHRRGGSGEPGRAERPARAAGRRSRLSRMCPAAALRAELDPANYTGRAAQQVGEFMDEYLQPLLARARPLAADAEAAEVRV